MSAVTLEISFYGPFVYELSSNSLQITAPRCPGHLASIYSDTDEKALLGCGPDKKTPYHYALQHIKQISIAEPAENAELDTTCINPENIILVETWRKRASPKPKNHHFQLDLPRPDSILGLIPDLVTYVEYDLNSAPRSSAAKRATAMRFYYTRFDQSDTFELVELAGDKPGLITKVEMNCASPRTHIPITFRYASNSIFDLNHDDAEECFMRMRAIFPSLGSWTADFDFGENRLKTALEKLGSDCKASAIMFVPLDDKKRWQVPVNEPPKN
jgi:hypothetical protein